MNALPLDILSFEWGWDNFRIDVFQLVAWGYHIKEAEIRKCEREEDITGLIRSGVREKLDEELPSRFQHYFPANEDPVDEHGVLGKKRPRVDILIESSNARPRKRYRLEAKRCHSHKSNYRMHWYAEGVTAFLEGLYANDSPEAGLLGLMQSDDAQYWMQKLAEKLATDSSLSATSSLTDVNLTPDLPFMSFSQHKRQDDSRITLFHAFLDCIQTASPE